MAALTNVVACGALNKGTRTRCKNPAMQNGRCRMHGGATPRGLANASTTNGRYSQDMPTRMMDRYLISRQDPELLSLRDDVAVIETLIKEKLAAVRDGDTGPDWTAVLDQFEAIAENFQKWEWTKQKKALEDLGALLKDRQRTEAAAMEEVRDLMDQKARLATMEHRRLVDLQQTMTVEQALTLASVLADIVRRNVKDPEALRIIQAEWVEATNSPSTENVVTRRVSQ